MAERRAASVRQQQANRARVYRASNHGWRPFEAGDVRDLRDIVGTRESMFVEGNERYVEPVCEVRDVNEYLPEEML